MTVPFPEGKFGAILADPPWAFECWSGASIPQRKKWGAVADYDSAPLEWILSLPVEACAAPDCTLFLWATMPLLPEALQVMAAWGFEYKTVAFTWVKVLADNPREPRMGLGYWTRANAELCLLGTRGKPKRLRKDVRQVVLSETEWGAPELQYEEEVYPDCGQVIAEPIREHSRKPDCIHGRIERLVPGKYLELFARAPWPGWTVWGLESDKFADPQQALALGVEP